MFVYIDHHISPFIDRHISTFEAGLLQSFVNYFKLLFLHSNKM